MDGNVAPMDKICDLADKYDALVMVDGRYLPECMKLVAVQLKNTMYTAVSTSHRYTGKAFGGAIGGFTTGKKEIIEIWCQRSRPYLFSNSIPPAGVVGAGLEVFKMLDESNELHTQLVENVTYFQARKMYCCRTGYQTLRNQLFVQ